MTDLPLLVDERGNSYNLILVIIDNMINISHYKPVKTTINIGSLAKVIIDIIVKYYNFLESIVSDKASLFISKFWFSLYYFPNIEWKLFNSFYHQTNGQTKKQNSTIKAHLRVFVHLKKNNWARFLSIIKFAYNNT